MAGSRQSRQRQLLADTVARLMREQGIQDFQLAKHKACDTLGIRSSHLPDNREIAEALRLQEALFAGADHRQHRQKLLELAAELLRNFADFKAKLSGRVAENLICAHSRLELHLFHDQPEAVDLFLQQRGVDYELDEVRLRFSHGHQALPAYRFERDGVEVTAILFSPRQRSQPPLSAIDGKAMRRINRQQLLLEMEKDQG